MPALVGGAFGAAPLPPPVKLMTLAVLLAGMSGLLLGLSGCEATRRVYRLALAWSLLAASFACLSGVLWLMAATWDGPRADALRWAILAGFAVGAGCMAAGLAALRWAGRARVLAS